MQTISFEVSSQDAQTLMAAHNALVRADDSWQDEYEMIQRLLRSISTNGRYPGEFTLACRLAYSSLEEMYSCASHPNNIRQEDARP